eukprot:gene9661-biopygen2858
MSQGGCSNRSCIRVGSALRGNKKKNRVNMKLRRHVSVWKGWGATVSDEMPSHGVGGGGVAASGIWQSRNVKWVTNMRVSNTQTGGEGMSTGDKKIC